MLDFFFNLYYLHRVDRVKERNQHMYKVIVCFLFVFVIPCFCYAEDDNQEYWGVTSFRFRLNEKWKMRIKEDFRFRAGDFSEQQNDVYFSKKTSETLDFGLGFRQVHKEDSSHEWQRENRPYADLTFKGDIFGLLYSDRSRLEFREFENKKDIFRYCNRLKLSSPNNLFDLPLRPYIADEITIQEENGYNRNRIYAGLVWNVNKKLDVDFIFIQQKEKTTHGWDNRSIMGFEMIFSF